MNQKGFTIVEFLLTIIALSLFAGVGLYAYNSIKDQQKHETAKADSVQQQKQVTQKQAVQPAVEYREFPEAGVKVVKTDALNDFYFVTDPQVPGSYYVHSARYDVLAKKCYGATEFAKMSEPIDNSISGFGRTSGKFNADEAIGELLLKQFDTFYISMGYPNGGIHCTAQDEHDAMKKMEGDLNRILVPILQKADKL